MQLALQPSSAAVATIVHPCTPSFLFLAYTRAEMKSCTGNEKSWLERANGRKLTGPSTCMPTARPSISALVTTNFLWAAYYTPPTPV